MIVGILEFIFSWLLAVFVASMPIVWVWVLYHKIKCRKVDSCVDRKCRYWDFCNHNREERKKDELEMRKRNLMHRYGLTEDGLDEESRST